MKLRVQVVIEADEDEDDDEQGGKPKQEPAGRSPETVANLQSASNSRSL